VPGLIPDQEATTAMAQFEASTPLEKFKKEAKRLEALSLAEAEDDWKNILQMIRDYLEEFAV
jgi:hypothetical protein